MKTLNISTALLLAGTIAAPALADDIYYDNARVISVVPQTERVNLPRQECHTEYQREAVGYGERDIGGSIIGGIAGGLLGSQIGKGSGRVAGAAVGAATGAIIGDRIDNSDRRERYAERPVERCVVVDNWQNVTRDYRVTYRYHGREYVTTLPQDPGNSLRIRVAVSPYHETVSSLEPRHDNGWHRGWNKRGRGWND